MQTLITDWFLLFISQSDLKTLEKEGGNLGHQETPRAQVWRSQCSSCWTRGLWKMLTHPGCWQRGQKVRNSLRMKTFLPSDHRIHAGITRQQEHLPSKGWGEGKMGFITPLSAWPHFSLKRENSAFSLETLVNSFSLCPPKLRNLEVLQKFLYLWRTCIRIIPRKWFKTKSSWQSRGVDLLFVQLLIQALQCDSHYLVVVPRSVYQLQDVLDLGKTWLRLIWPLDPVLSVGNHLQGTKNNVKLYFLFETSKF